MLAKCSRCSQTFQTDRYGEQFCPFCGAQVLISAPNGQPGAPSGAPPPGGTGAPLPPSGQEPAPIDVPAQFGGWWKAAVETWKKSVFDPTVSFARWKPGPDTGGALGYGVAIVAVAGVLQALVNFILWPLNRAQMHALMPLLEKTYPPETIEKIMRFSKPGLLTLFGAPIGGVIGLFIAVALLHLALMIVGGNKGGFGTTMRAVCLSRGPELFVLVPFIGPMAAFFWTLILGVIAISSMHHITIGRTIGAYAVLIVGACCFCCVPVTAVVTWAIQQAMQHGGGASPFDTP